MEKGPKPRSLPIAISELLVFLWNSKSVVIAKPKKTKQRIRKSKRPGGVHLENR